jgi:hypothetical protein
MIFHVDIMPMPSRNGYTGLYRHVSMTVVDTCRYKAALG